MLGVPSEDDEVAIGRLRPPHRPPHLVVEQPVLTLQYCARIEQLLGARLSLILRRATHEHMQM